MNKKERLKFHMRVFISVIMLVVITLFMLAFPKLIYKKQDQRLVSAVSKSQYSTVNMNVQMSEEQVIEAMYNNDTMFVDTIKTYSASQIAQYKGAEYGMLVSCLDGYWQNVLKVLFYDANAIAKLMSLKIIRIEEDTIYFSEIGILTIYNSKYMDSAGYIIFDMASKKILQLSIWLNADYTVQFDNPSSISIYGDISENDDLGIVDVNKEEYQKMMQDLDKYFLFPEEYKEYTDYWINIGKYGMYISPFEMCNVHYEMSEFGEYLVWEYNSVNDKLLTYIN